MLIRTVLRALADVTGMAFPFVTKNEIYIHHFLKIISKAVGIAYIVLLRQTGRRQAMAHMQTHKITWLV